ncbi:hypothetical protein ACQY1Q_01095 [Tenacibaculum sp. TC6]|uniref:hypothetical protein n=1 Tax=Tenacibaculum sp. TC6 TaxID=3423223 RepID=UPI003D36D52D
MKKTTQTLLVLAMTVFSSFQVAAQQTTETALDNVISSAETIKNTAEQAKTTVKTLVVDYLVMNDPTPNTEAFLLQIKQELQTIEEYTNKAYSAVYEAESLNPSIDVANVEDLGQEIQSASYQINNNSQALVTAINSQNNEEVTRLNTLLRNSLNAIIGFTEDMQIEATNLKAVPEIFKVRIQLVDERTGAPVSADTIHGYAATNVATNQHYYTQERQGDPINEFLALPEATYRFDGFDGYFDGTGSKVVTLSSDLVQQDGYIIVTLSYWSE